MNAMTTHVALEPFAKTYQDIFNASARAVLAEILIQTVVFQEKYQVNAVIQIHALMVNNAFYTKEKMFASVLKVFLVTKKLGYVKISMNAHSTDVHLAVLMQYVRICLEATNANVLQITAEILTTSVRSVMI